MGTASVILYAVWTPTFTVTYNGNGNTSGTAPTDGNAYLSGASVTVANSGSLMKIGFAFAGWNTAADGSGTGHGAGTSMIMGSGNVTLYAVWTPTYTVTYNGNGYSSGSVPADGTSYLPGASVTIKLQGTMVRNGFTFTGWNTQANGSGTSYAAGSLMTMGSGNVTLYAVWTTWSVYYVGNGNDGGTVPTDGLGYPAGATVNVAGPGTMSLSTGFFVGWNTAANGTGAAYAASDTFTMGTANVTLYAMWATVSGRTITSVPLSATNVVIPEGVTGFGTAFYNHPNLASVTLPSTISTITVQAFLDCAQLTTIVSNNSRYQVINGALVDTSGAGTLMLVPAKLNGAFTIPSVASIDSAAFSQCTNLTSITIPVSLSTIGGNAFTDLRSAIPIIIPPTVTSIADLAFYRSSFTSITIPSSVGNIGSNAMGACSSLTNVTMLGTTPPTLTDSSVFASSPVIVHVADAATKAAYLANTNWAATGVSIVYP